MIDHLVAQLQAVLDQYRKVESKLEAVQRLSRFKHVLWLKETLNDSSEDFDKVRGIESELDLANLITSQLGGENSHMHAPVLDIDFYVHVEPSTTPGHYHLFMDKAMPWDQYKRFLITLGAFDILEQGFVQASMERGASTVRLPWVRKELPTPTGVHTDYDDENTFVITHKELHNRLKREYNKGLRDGRAEKPVPGGYVEAIQNGAAEDPSMTEEK